jgi:hypothetical protein
MADTSTCPGCATPVRVPEGMAGKRARCPKCQMIFTVTADAPAVASAAPPPQFDLFSERDRAERAKASKRLDDEENDRGRRRDRERDDDEPRRRPSRKPQSGGSALPWVLGILGVSFLLIVICGGGAIAVAIIGFREREPHRDPVVLKKDGIAMPPVGVPPGPGAGGVPGQPVQARFGPITKLQLNNGVVQVTSQLTFQDPFDPDPDAQGHRAKFYQIELQQGRRYQIDMTSPNVRVLDPFLRIEDVNGMEHAKNDDINPGVDLNSRIIFSPPATGAYVIFATTFDANHVGQFTLTIRELK